MTPFFSVRPRLGVPLVWARLQVRGTDNLYEISTMRSDQRPRHKTATRAHEGGRLTGATPGMGNNTSHE